MNEIVSPITKSNKAIFERDIDVSSIIKVYNKFNIDVSSYFKNVKKVAIYCCSETGYRFYYPFQISGDTKFYEHFQKFDWYYMPWKWEHEITLKHIRTNTKILEVGCAHGAFIKKINSLFNLDSTVGLELNESAKELSPKWEIRNETIENFSKSNSEIFDLVCSFQVLEHVSDVHSFLQAQINCLKKGGTLIISVPNNDSYLKSGDFSLNMPPHHMGLWNKKSLHALETIFPLRLIETEIEELAEYHVETYVLANYYSKYPSLLRKLIRKKDKIFGKYEKHIKNAHAERHKITGHTILVAYTKL